MRCLVYKKCNKENCKVLHKGKRIFSEDPLLAHYIQMVQGDITSRSLFPISWTITVHNIRYQMFLLAWVIIWQHTQCTIWSQRIHEKYQIEKKMHRQECFACLEDFLSGIQTCFVCLAVSWPDTVTTSKFENILKPWADIQTTWAGQLLPALFLSKIFKKQIWINGRQNIMKWKSLYLQRKSSIRFLQLGPTGRASA